MGAMLNGGGIVTLTENKKFDPANLWETVQREGVTSMAIVGDAFAKPILKALDADTTLVTYELGVELSLPVPRMMISKTEKTTINQALKELQAQFE